MNADTPNMDATDGPNTSSASPSSRASASLADHNSVISFSRSSLELQPSLSSGKRSRLPAAFILSAFFVLLLLGIAGAGGYHYYSNNMKATRAHSSVIKASSIKSVSKTSSRANSPALSGSGASSGMVSSPIERAQLAISRHPRSFVAGLFAVVVTAALIATVLVLVRLLNTPPQVITNTVPVETHSVSTETGMSPLAIGLAAAAAILFVVATVGAGLAYKFKRSGALAKDAQDSLQSELNRVGNERNAYQQLYQGYLRWAEDNILSAGAPVMDAARLEDHQYLKECIRYIFNDIRGMVPLAGGEDWAAKNTRDPRFPNNLYIVNSNEYGGAMGHPSSYIQTLQGNTVAQYFADMLRSRNTLADNRLKDHFFALLAYEGDISGPQLPPSSIVPVGARFVAIFIDHPNNTLEVLRIIATNLLGIKAEIERMILENGRMLPVREVPDNHSDSDDNYETDEGEGSGFEGPPSNHDSTEED